MSEAIIEISNDEVKMIKGFIYYFFGDDCINQLSREIKETELNGYHIYDIFSGEEFIDMISNGSISNYDGSIANIFVDDYLSNLGICCPDPNFFIGGKFLVDVAEFLDMCKSYKIEINWVNK